jgi:Xaa-Pro dipeptidase
MLMTHAIQERSAALQEAVRAAGIDGWLLYDFRRSNPIAHRALGIDPHHMFSRRWFYYIPAQGEPVALISAVEPHVLSELPGSRHIFQTWRELHAFLRETLAGAKRVAMEYTPDNAIPVCSRVDAGTVDLIRSLGVEVVSSANLAQRFEATLSPAQIETHRDASKRLLAAKEATVQWVRERLNADDATLTEYSVQQQFGEFTRQQGLTFEHGHIVAVNAHAGDPHYATDKDAALPVRRGDLLLLDFTGRLANIDDSVIADYTWVYFLGAQVPERAAQLFAIVCQARDAGIAFIRQRVEASDPVMGFEVDDHVRAIVREAGYGAHFVHRTGHNIGTATHGNGANLDNLETHDDRLLLPNTCCSMEPGIYLPDIGVRSEVNVLVLDGAIEVTGVPAQTAITPLLA